MLTFKIFEIPEGHSERTVELDMDEFDLGENTLKSGTVYIEFYRTLHFIRTKFQVDATVELICDRSLDEFDYDIEQNYEVLFKAEKIEESADENGAIRNFDHANKQISLEQDVRDTILLNLPSKKLHPRFLDEEGNPKETFNQKYGDVSDDDVEKTDPRWDKLKDLKE